MFGAVCNGWKECLNTKVVSNCQCLVMIKGRKTFSCFYYCFKIPYRQCAPSLPAAGWERNPSHLSHLLENDLAEAGKSKFIQLLGVLERFEGKVEMWIKNKYWSLFSKLRGWRHGDWWEHCICEKTNHCICMKGS